MRKTMQGAIFGTLLAGSQLFAQGTGAAKPTGTGATVPDKVGDGQFIGTLKGLFGDPYIWALVIGLAVLIGIFVWVRKRQAEE